MDVYWQVATGTVVCVFLAIGTGYILAKAWTAFTQAIRAKRERKACGVTLEQEAAWKRLRSHADVNEPAWTIPVYTVLEWEAFMSHFDNEER